MMNTAIKAEREHTTNCLQGTTGRTAIIISRTISNPTKSTNVENATENTRKYILLRRQYSGPK